VEEVEEVEELLTAGHFLDYIEAVGPTALSSPTIGRALLHFLADLGAKDKERLFATIKRWAGADRPGRPRQPRRQAPLADNPLEVAPAGGLEQRRCPGSRRGHTERWIRSSA
jgi:hypothetical protein